MLTRKQHELLTFIDRHLQTTGFAPSFEEMMHGLNLRSKSGIHRLISGLEERRFIRRRIGRARAIEVLRMPPDVEPPHQEATLTAEEHRLCDQHPTIIRAVLADLVRGGAGQGADA